MFEYHINRISNDIIKNVNFSDPSIKLSTILDNPDIPQFCKKFFDAEADWLIYEEGLIRQANANFDFSDQEFSGIFQQLDAALKNNTVFSKQDFSDLVKNSVMTRINFLTSPKRALKWFVFRGEPTKSINEITSRILYFVDYPYLTELLYQKISESAKDSMSVFEFEKIIEKIDAQNISGFKTDKLIDLLTPVFEILSDQDDNPNVPVEALIIFFNDKGFANLGTFLKRNSKKSIPKIYLQNN